MRRHALLGVLLAALAAGPASARQVAGPPPAPEPEPPPSFMSAAEAAPPRGLRVNAEGAFDGYTLFAPINDTAVYLIGMDGEVAHTWKTDSAPGEWLYLRDDGTLLRAGRVDDDPRFRGGGIGGKVQILAPDGELLWSWRLADEFQTQHHDLEPLPNGNVLVVAWERVPARDAVERGRHPDFVGAPGLWPDAVLEVRPVPPDEAEIVWEWHAWDHVVQNRAPELPGFGEPADFPGLIDVNGDHAAEPPKSAEELEEEAALEDAMAALGYVGGEEEPAEEADPEAGARFQRSGDWLHTNGIDYQPEYDLVVMSSPNFDELWVIDHSTTTEQAAGSLGGRWGHGGDLLWRWGHPLRYGMGGAADQRLFAQHDPTWIAGGRPGELRLLVFNNQRGGDAGYSAVDELVLPFDPDHGFRRERGRPFGPEEPVWSYADPGGFFSGFISGAQRLPNGNTLICSGAPGRIFEVTRDGRVVWDYRNPYGGSVVVPDHAGHAPKLALFRATRLAPDDPGVRALLR